MLRDRFVECGIYFYLDEGGWAFRDGHGEANSETPVGMKS